MSSVSALPLVLIPTPARRMALNYSPSTHLPRPWYARRYVYSEVSYDLLIGRLRGQNSVSLHSAFDEIRRASCRRCELEGLTQCPHNSLFGEGIVYFESTTEKAIVDLKHRLVV